MTKQNKKKIEEKLEEIKQEVKLGSFDSAILACSLFFVPLMIGLLSTNNMEIWKPYPYILIGMFYMALPMLTVLGSLIIYVTSIIRDKDRFKNKISYIARVGISFLFVVEIWILLLIFWVIEGLLHWTIPTCWVNILFGISIVIAIISFKPTKNKIEKYFREQYPDIYK
jgi:hypothetical protein